jgi:hypothetical protein
MGSVTSTPIPNWRKNSTIQRLLDSHMIKNAKVVEVNLVVRKEYPTARPRKYAEVIYILGEKLCRAELKLRDDRHWDKRGKDDKGKREGVKGSHLTASDILGEEGVSDTEEVVGRLQL